MSPFQFMMMVVFVIGLILVGIDLIRTYNKCPENKIIYRYLPRSFIEDQENPVPLDDIFYSMFNNPTVWISAIDFDTLRQDVGQDINRYYVSQI
jgi:hypothetical protein